MGQLVEGKWVKGSIVKSDSKGGYNRQARSFREDISDSHKIYKPESGRYHLYVSFACPWAHRTLIYRKLKGLDKHISVNIVHPDMLSDGWVFDDSFPGSTKDDLSNFKLLREVYLRSVPDITTSVTVPILWDKKTHTIVNNESSEIIRIFNEAFDKITGNTDNYYPHELTIDIDKMNEKIYKNVNNGVYLCGFAKTQSAYDQAVTSLFETLDDLDLILSRSKFLLGEKLTEADLRLIPTLLRFDIVYFTHFKCNSKRISDYKNLGRYTRELFEIEAIKSTTNFEHIKRHYYYSHETINPYRIIPRGPNVIL